ncbi:hypothetical protein [Aquimarina longa]|uniref:hypothetical protein n=1 Tax=Aquimarina longa TaxID=1080221 RepID=UPI000784675F|nr:hypothetical protein [Aquimarina longa]
MSSNKENRKQLKTFFEAGDRPTEAQFSKLINSVVVQQSDKLFINNQHEIGLGQDPENGKRLTILGEVKINNGGLVANGGGIKLIENGNSINLQPGGISYLNSDKIGIGVENPQKKLHIRVYNEPERSGATPLMIENSEPNNEWVGMLWRREGKRDWGVYSEDGDFSIWQSDTYNSPSGSYPFVIKENGNIGIGTTDPDAQLCIHTSPSERSIMLRGGNLIKNNILVNTFNLPPTDELSDGAINVITNDWNTSNGLGLIRSANVASPIVWMYEFGGRNAFTVARKKYRGSGQDASNIGDDLTPLFQVRENGNVGIGTTNPRAKLELSFQKQNLHYNALFFEDRGYHSNSGATNIAIKVPYAYWDGVSYNEERGYLDLIKTVGGNTILATRNTDNALLGKVGIGTVQPQKELDVNGGIIANSLEVKKSLVVKHREGSGEGWNIQSFGYDSTPLYFSHHYSGGSATFMILHPDSRNNNSYLTLYGKIIVKNQGSVIPDYVFEENYPLMPLSKVKKHIKKYKHLPEIPSAKEVERKGVDMLDTVLLLLKKVEELTLYAIDQEERISALEK